MLSRPQCAHSTCQLRGLLQAKTDLNMCVCLALLVFGKSPRTYVVCWVQAKTMGMKAIPASNLVVETLGLQGQLTPEQFLANRERILHKTFASASLLPGDSYTPLPSPSPCLHVVIVAVSMHQYQTHQLQHSLHLCK